MGTSGLTLLPTKCTRAQQGLEPGHYHLGLTGPKHLPHGQSSCAEMRRCSGPTQVFSLSAVTMAKGNVPVPSSELAVFLASPSAPAPSLRPGFLNLCTADILGQIILCHGELSCALHGVQQQLYPLSSKCQEHLVRTAKMSPDIAKCLLGAKWPWLRSSGEDG